jgi:4-amino-4-deoxy-L-arabinose transferase-like glycosyltransferase
MEVRTRYLFVILTVGTLLFLFNLGGRDLWEPDETRYAVIAREMRETGNWVLPHLNGEIYAEKPPLFFWLVNLSTFFLGENSELANRLPSALAGWITLFVTFLFGERLFHPRVGFLSAMVLGTSFLFLQLSRWMMLDSLVTLFFLLTLYYFYLGAEREEKRRKYYLWAGLFMGLGVLTKGPIAYLPIPIFLIFTSLQREAKKFWNLNLLYGFFISFMVILIWLVPACFLGGESYTERILVQQTLGRLVEGGRHFHPRPFYFYFLRFPVEFLPWALFLPAAWLLGIRRIKEKKILFLFIWFLFILFFLTLSKGKKDNYILPLYPAAAILVSALWDDPSPQEWERRGLIGGLLGLPFLSFILFFLFLSGLPQKRYPALIPYHPLGVTLLSLLLIGSFCSLVLYLKKLPRGSFMGLVITFAVIHLHIAYPLPRILNPQWSMKPFAERILKRMEAGGELKTCFFQSSGLVYYTRKSSIEIIRSESQFWEVFRSPKQFFFVIKVRDFKRLKEEEKMKISPIEQTRAGGRDLLLISNR